MEETAIHRTVLQKAHRAGIRIRDDGLRAVVRFGDRGEFGSDRVECLVPRYALEMAFPLLAHAPQRVQHALVRIGPLEVVRDLGAQDAGGRRVVGSTANLDRAPVLDGHLQRTRVGAVVRAGGANHGAGRGAWRAGIRGHDCRARELLL